MIFVLFLSIAILRGLYAVVMKLSQKEYVHGLTDSLYLIVLTSFFQLVFLFILPPYYKMDITLKMMTYPASFAVTYMFSLIFLLGAYRIGSTSLSSVVQNFSMFVPIAVGIVLWNESVGLFKLLGILMFILALFLFNKGTYKSGTSVEKITLKWVFVILLSTVFAGISGLTSKLYALEFSQSPKEYLIAFNFFIVVCGSIYFSWLNIKGKYKPSFSFKLIGFSAIIGLIADIVNIVFMKYVAQFDSAFFFPMLSASSIISVVLMSRLFLKEQVSKKAYIGILLCIMAIILLNR